MNFYNGRTAPSIELKISPSVRPGYFTARLADNRELVASSRHPFLDAARALLREGCDPTIVMVMRHGGSQTESLRATIGAAAKLTVAEGELDPPRFRRWKPFLSREGSPRTRQNGEAAIRGRSGDFNAPVTPPITINPGDGR